MLDTNIIISAGVFGGTMQKKAKIINLMQEEVKQTQKSMDRLFQKELNRGELCLPPGHRPL